MSQPNFESETTTTAGISVTKPKSGIYTVLLVLALIALIIGCIFLYAEISTYKTLSPSASVSPVERARMLATALYGIG